MKILLHGLNFSPEPIGIGKYSGEMIEELVKSQHFAVVVTTPPYYPQWKVAEGFRQYAYTSETLHHAFAKIIRCPLWVPRKVTGLKRVLHLASFGVSSIPIVLWNAIRFRPDVIMTVEPAAFCMPTTLFAAWLCGAKTWLHVQDFEVDAAFQLGLFKHKFLRRLVTAVEGFLMRRFDRVSSISPNMLLKLAQKGVREEEITSFPNWVDCETMRPLGPQDFPTTGANQAGDEGRWLNQLRSQFGIPNSKCIALYAGNIGAKQGLEILLDVARRQTANEHLHFVICGSGAAHQTLVEAANGLKNVQFLPVQPFERFNELMNCADIHLLPQRADAADLVMPSKLTGMLATGRPVVACADSGTQIADVVQNRGIVVPPENPEAFGAAIHCLADDPEMRQTMGANAREYAEKHMSRASILAQFVRDLSSLRHPMVDVGIPTERRFDPPETETITEPPSAHARSESRSTVRR